MAITVNRVPQFTFLCQQGFRDQVLALPTHLWALLVSVTGDATGGEIIINADFRINLFLKFVASLEEAMGQHSDVLNNLTYEVSIIPGEGYVAGENLAIQAQSGQSAAGFRQSAAFVRGTNSFVKPSNGWLPGQPFQINSGTPFAIIAGNANLNVYKFYMWGYLWDKALIKRGFMPVRP